MFFMNGLHAAEVVEIPSGQIEAIWLTPVSKKDEKKAEKKEEAKK